jgi:hypothetical protein
MDDDEARRDHAAGAPTTDRDAHGRAEDAATSEGASPPACLDALRREVERRAHSANACWRRLGSLLVGDIRGIAMFPSVVRRWRKGPMSELIIPLLSKGVLSGVLVLLAFVFLWQTWRMWFNRSLVLAPFDFLEAGKPAPDSGEQFARLVWGDLVELADLYNAGEVPNAGAVVSDPAIVMKIPAVFDTSFFESVELKAYGIEFGSIFKTLRRQLESPSEITGSVRHQGDTYSVFAELRQAGGGPESLRRWNIQYAKSLPEATRDVACRIFRLLAANPVRDTADTLLYRTVDDEDFCLFNQALAAYDQYRLRKGILSDADAAKLLADAAQPLVNLRARDVVTFPYVHKLAALVFYEQGKYIEAENSIRRYMLWLEDEQRSDHAAETLDEKIKSKKAQLTPAVSKRRPVQPGSSVGSFAEKGAGMICCIAKDAAGRRYLLSAVSVLGSSLGAKIVQPAVRDGGTEADVVAEWAKTTATVAVA